MSVANKGAQQTTGAAQLGTILITDFGNVATVIPEYPNIDWGNGAALRIGTNIECVSSSSVGGQHGTIGW
jgi:hypothetical protein